MAEANRPASEIDWPEGLSPDRAPVYTRNEALSEADVDCVWAWLVRLPLWSTFHPDTRRVALTSGPPDALALGSRFVWPTLGLRVIGVVEQCVPGARLDWSGTAPGVRAYHAWVLEPEGEGCRILSQESQTGWLPGAARLLMRPRIHADHQRWVESLAEVARSGMPPDPR